MRSLAFSLLLLMSFVPVTTAQNPAPTRTQETGNGASTLLSPRREKPDDQITLTDSIKRGDLASVKTLLAAGVDPDAADAEGELPLNRALRLNQTEILETLLAAGADVNASEDDGDTPLMVAASVGRVNLVQSLLTKGAEVNAKDDGGHTPLINAAMGAMTKIMPAAIAQSLVSEDNDGWQALLKAMGDDHSGVVKLLLARGANVNAQATDCQLTALMVAALIGDLELVKTLLAHGADVKLKSNGWTALKFADVVMTKQLEREIKADPEFDAQAKQAFTDWVRDTKQTRIEIVRLLKQAGTKK